jgi:hypothetical protein
MKRAIGLPATPSVNRTGLVSCFGVVRSAMDDWPDLSNEARPARIAVNFTVNAWHQEVQITCSDRESA